jgi:hypothetical protein
MQQRSKGTAAEKAQKVAAVVQEVGGTAVATKHPQGTTLRVTIKEHQGVVRWDRKGRYVYPKSHLDGRKVRNVAEVIRRLEVLAKAS